ncbi:MAG: sialate O-acetylesterase [Pirellulaceae bacterium]|nr:sialate O-acetylesterase [Pirellulaceae bacterium]
MKPIIRSAISLAIFCTLYTSAVAQQENQNAAQKSPVKIYILSGQSNMVGIGQVTGGGVRWGDEFIDPVVSVYPGAFDPAVDYDRLQPESTSKLEKFGGVEPTPFPKGGTPVVRGKIQVTQTGQYEFRPGYGGSTYNIMEVNGQEVYRKEPGADASFSNVDLTAGKAVPFKITYLNQQANGLGWIVRSDIPGTLSTLVKQEGKFPYLLNAQGNWKERPDVWYKGLVTAGADKWLSVGCGASGNQIGPELGFGFQMGDHHDEPVIILKSSQGNRSLGWDFLPPGSPQLQQDGVIYAGYKESPASWDIGTQPKPIDWYAGKQYDDCFQAVHQVLDNFDHEFPQFAGRGYEIAGFAWWQGHKDQGSEVHTQHYEQNLVHLIDSLREEFQVPEAPFVIATIGFDGRAMSGNALTVANAQLAVSGEQGNYPKFRGNVKTVETRDFWRDAKESPREQGFHYNQNGETYMLVGEALGRGMLELLKTQND